MLDPPYGLNQPVLILQSLTDTTKFVKLGQTREFDNLNKSKNMESWKNLELATQVKLKL